MQIQLMQLVAENRDLFGDRYPGPEFGEGWSRIFEQLLHELRSAGVPTRITTTKEKLGTHRVDFEDRLNEAAKELAIRAQEESASTCDLYGRPGWLRSIRGFVATRCPFCISELQPMSESTRSRVVVLLLQREP
ncbi:hypothetical protein IT571_01495 [Candidatus Sumerlaeota bacterium]|nr:hypothetical protein [Candidatus Sumerlaeota bacterium]